MLPIITPEAGNVAPLLISFIGAVLMGWSMSNSQKVFETYLTNRGVK